MRGSTRCPFSFRAADRRALRFSSTRGILSRTSPSFFFLFFLILLFFLSRKLHIPLVKKSQERKPSTYVPPSTLSKPRVGRPFLFVTSASPPSYQRAEARRGISKCLISCAEVPSLQPTTSISSLHTHVRILDIFIHIVESEKNYRHIRKTQLPFMVSETRFQSLR